MELNEYQEKAMATCMPSCNNFSYMMLNLIGEVGELASKVAKDIRKVNAVIGHGMEMSLFLGCHLMNGLQGKMNTRPRPVTSCGSYLASVEQWDGTLRMWRRVILTSSHRVRQEV